MIPKKSKYFVKNLAIMKDLFIVNQARGLDGAGIYAFDDSDSQKQMKLVKGDMHPVDALSKALCGFKEYMVGHCRAATKGAVTAGNAHPFQFGDITMSHNGTLTDYFDLGKHYNIPPNAVAVDSMMLAAAMADATSKKEEEDELKAKDDENFVGDNTQPFLEPLKHIRGAYAITLRSELFNGLFFFRNKERSLYFAKLGEDGKEGYVWASESLMIHYVLARHGLKMDEDFKIFEFLPGKLYNLTKEDGMIIVCDLPEEKSAPEFVHYGHFGQTNSRRSLHQEEDTRNTRDYLYARIQEAHELEYYVKVIGTGEDGGIYFANVPNYLFEKHNGSVVIPRFFAGYLLAKSAQDAHGMRVLVNPGVYNNLSEKRIAEIDRYISLYEGELYD